jgi:2'-5' RNA ligase
MTRAFIALTLPENILAALGSASGELIKRFDAKWVKPEALHLTLKFLGNVDEGTLKALSIKMDETASLFSPFDMQLASLGAFPQAKRARIIWAGIDTDIIRLRDLTSSIDAFSAQFGITKEERTFSAHITLARLKTSAVVDLDIKVPALNFTAKKMHLYKSELSQQGAKYTVLHSSPFTGASGG